jgi:hypothetical protein
MLSAVKHAVIGKTCMRPAARCETRRRELVNPFKILPVRIISSFSFRMLTCGVVDVPIA